MLQSSQFLLILIWAMIGAYQGGFVYRLGGDEVAPGGTQAARAMWRCSPFAAFAVAAVGFHYPPIVAVGAGIWLWVMLFTGLLILPHGAFQGLAKHPVRWDKLPARIVFMWLGLPYTRAVCMWALGVIGMGRLALALSTFAFLPFVAFGAPVAWEWFGLVPFGLFHGIAYSWGWRFRTWFEFIERGNEWAEFIWGTALGAFLGCTSAVVAFG